MWGRRGWGCTGEGIKVPQRGCARGVCLSTVDLCPVVAAVRSRCHLPPLAGGGQRGTKKNKRSRHWQRQGTLTGRHSYRGAMGSAGGRGGGRGGGTKHKLAPGVAAKPQ